MGGMPVPGPPLHDPPLHDLPLPDPPLHDGRVVLRPWVMDDVADLLAGARDPIVHRYRVSVPDDEPGARAWLSAVVRDRERGERLELAVCAPDDLTALGSVSLWGIHRRNRDAMLSWWMGPRGRGRGLATASVGLLADWAFATLQLARLAATIEESNAASRRLAERCGFVTEGRLRAYQQLRDGTRADCLSYSLLADDLRPGD
jgi:RimJ/RimL family protein N-acetyltransferase